jgi:hypothetical protein
MRNEVAAYWTIRDPLPSRSGTTMRPLRRFCLTWAVLLGPLVAYSQYVTGDVANGSVPENATASSYGPGWRCETGYRDTDGRCVAIEVPENAYLEDRGRGDGWRCKRGFRKIDGQCQAIEIPENGYLEYGTNWRCDRGYQAKEGECVQITVPENGRLSDSEYGSGWKCNHGFTPDGNRCVAIQVPENGHLTERTNRTGWECDRGYKATSDECIAVVVPENAHLSPSGDSWTCDPPFKKSDTGCEMR